MSPTQTQPTPSALSPTLSVAGPAVSARILKKRETDRRCQRMIRERTKSRIAYLESLVEQFREQDASGRVETLMQQLSDMKSERDVLAKKVKSIESIISDGHGKQDTEEQILETPDLILSKAQCNGNEEKFAGAPTFRQQQPEAEHPFYQIFNKEFEARGGVPKANWAPSPILGPQDAPCECSQFGATDPTKPVNKWRYANECLTAWFKWPTDLQTAKVQPDFNDDVPVRAIVEGWEAVEKRSNVHPAWLLLKGIDQTIFGRCEKRERLAILQVMGLLLQAHLNPSTEHHTKLPSFYLKRPSQDMLHAYATEYFAWPGLRERFVFSEHRYCSNIFWKVFCRSLRVQWPYEFRDCYTRNTETGLYKLSPLFHERIHDIRHWTMGREMFQEYPELYGDLPTWNHIPASVSGAGYQSRLLLESSPAGSHTTETVEKDERFPHTDHSSKGLTRVNSSNFTSEPNVSGSLTQVPQPVPAAEYDYALREMMQNFSSGQALPTFTNYGFNAGLDIFQLDAF